MTLSVNTLAFESPCEPPAEVGHVALSVIQSEQPWLLSILSGLATQSPWITESIAQAAIETLTTIDWPFSEQIWRAEHSFMLDRIKAQQFEGGFAQWFILASLMGVQLDVMHQLEHPTILSVLGECYLATSKYHVEQRHGELFVRIDGEPVLHARYNLKNQCWIPTHSYGASVEVDGKRIELIAYNEGIMEHLRRPLIGSLKMPIHEAELSLQSAIEMLQSSSERYTEWVKRGLNQIVMFHFDKDPGIEMQEFTYSSNTSPGVIAFKMPFSKPDLLAEALVHEVSHGYLHMIQATTTLFNDLDHKEYYSPIKKRNRPLPMIATACHAVFNIIAFLEESAVSHKGSQFGDLQRSRLSEYKTMLPMYSEVLCCTRGLTQAGELFFSRYRT